MQKILIVAFILCSCTNVYNNNREIYQRNLNQLLETATDKDYGELPKGYKIATEISIKLFLKDPDSVKFKWGEPYKCNFPESKNSTAPLLGWCFRVYYNAKNSFGAYTGYKMEEFRLRKGRIHSVCENTQLGLVCSR